MEKIILLNFNLIWEMCNFRNQINDFNGYDKRTIWQPRGSSRFFIAIPEEFVESLA